MSYSKSGSRPGRDTESSEDEAEEIEVEIEVKGEKSGGEEDADDEGDEDDDSEDSSIEVETCLVCSRAHTKKDVLSKKGEAAKKVIAESLGFKTGGNQFKLGHSKPARDKGVTLINATTKYDPEMRWCRILSTVARAYLLTQFKVVEEVQCAFDEANGRFVLSTNHDKQTRKLSEAKWPQWLENNNNLRPISKQPAQFMARAALHMGLLKGADAPGLRFIDARDARDALSTQPRTGSEKDLVSSCSSQSEEEPGEKEKRRDEDEADGEDGGDMQVDVPREKQAEAAENGTKAQASRKRRRDEDEDPEEESEQREIKKGRTERKEKTTLPKDWADHLEYVVSADSSQVVHTETRIIYQIKDALLQEKADDPAAFQKKYTGKKIWVAGVMRPCLCCFTRLQRLENEFRDEGLAVSLMHKPRPGLFWPTTNAMNGMTEADFASVNTFVKELQTPDKPRLYMTDASAKGYTIDSDTEDDTEDEGGAQRNEGDGEDQDEEDEDGEDQHDEEEKDGDNED